jgi:predicted dehydrogenase
MSKARIGIVSATGTGRKRTIPALTDSALCAVTAIHGRDGAKLQQLSEGFKIPEIYTDLGEFISTRNFDIAVVCSPPFLHYEQASRLIAAGIPCLIEKPVTLSAAEAVKLKNMSEMNSVPVRVAHHLRHQNTFMEIKHALLEESVGHPISASFEWSFTLNREAPSSAWKLNPAMNGKTALYDAGAHCVDVAIGILGPGNVTGINARKLPGDRTYESVDMLSQHGDVMCMIRASRLYGPFSNDLKINATAGQVVAHNFLTEHSSDSIDIRSAAATRSIARTSESPYRLEVEDFVRVVQGNSSLYGDTTLDDAIAAIRMLEQVDALLPES